MADTSMEEILSEDAFVQTLVERVPPFLGLAAVLTGVPQGEWTRTHHFRLVSESDALESLLDEHGARYNRRYAFLRELSAALRSFSQAGFSLVHLSRRLSGYGVTLSERETGQFHKALQETRSFVERSERALLAAACDELAALGVHCDAPLVKIGDELVGPKRMLPRNLGQEDVPDDEGKAAEIASKYLQACAKLEEIGVHRISEEPDRDEWLRRHCSEEKARVFEAAIHNLQSVYDTHVKNSPAEQADARLLRLRGHISIVLHLLEAVTLMTHFVERHVSGQRHEALERRMLKLIPRGEVREHTLNNLLYWASTVLRRGRALAEDLLPAYTNLDALTVELPKDVMIHARPASLIVGIVQHYAMPVELEIDGARCNAGSILELLLAVGSHPDARRFVFHGDARPLADIQALFQHALGEQGAEKLPEALAYLKRRG